MKNLPFTNRPFQFLAVLLVGCSLLLASCGDSRDAYTEGVADGLYAKVMTTKGDFLIRLEYEKAPMTVANFVGLAEGEIKNSARAEGAPFFDGLTFHRYAPNFVIQGGDPLGNGMGNPGYQFPQEIKPNLNHHVLGTVAMANSGPNTNGCQWYVTVGPASHLDGGYNVFGYVIKGMEAVNQLRQNDKMTKIQILRFGMSAASFDAPGTFYEKSGVKKDQVKLPVK